MASSTPNDDWFQSAAAAQIRSERFERAELLNGRAAMIGFVVGVLTEALTGRGIVSQITQQQHSIQCKGARFEETLNLEQEVQTPRNCDASC